MFSKLLGKLRQCKIAEQIVANEIRSSSALFPRSLKAIAEGPERVGREVSCRDDGGELVGGDDVVNWRVFVFIGHGVLWAGVARSPSGEARSRSP